MDEIGGTGMRSVVRAIGLITLALLSTGCIKVDLALRLHTDNTVDGTMTYAVSKDLLTLTNSSPDALLGQVASGGPLPAGIAYRTADYDDGTFVGKTLTFDRADITTFQQSGIGGESLSIQRVGDTFQVNGVIDLTRTSTGPLQPGAAQLAKDMQLRLAITFPGPVQDQTGGTETGNTVTWIPTYGEKTEIHAIGSALGDPTGRPLLWVVLGVAALIVIAAAVIVVRRRGSRVVPSEPGATIPVDDPAS